jgi:hypothetical protein
MYSDPAPKLFTPAENDQVDPRPAIAAAVARTSVAAVSRAMGIPREQIARLVACVRVQNGTLALARERLRRLDREQGGR